MKHARIIAVLCAALLAFSPAAMADMVTPTDLMQPAYDTPSVVDQGLELMGHSIHYPQLTGLANEALQASVNAALLEKGQIEALIARLPLLFSAPTPLTVDYQYTLQNGVFSCVMSAYGPVQDLRDTHVWSALNVDLTTGEPIGFDDLFTDAEAARSAITDLLEQEVLPTLSAHLRAAEVTPLPEVFAISAQGLTLYYPIERLCTLSDRAGAVQVLWSELTPWLMLDEGSVLDRIGAAQAVTLDATSRDAIAQCVAEGYLPGIPAALGDSMQTLTDRYHMLTDPDLYEGGRMFALEDSSFRGVWLLTDALTARTWETSTVQGIRCDRACLYGLCTGLTTLDDWRAALGEPDASIHVDEERADAWRIVPGDSDYYVFGDHRLRLHADENGVLSTIFLTW